MAISLNPELGTLEHKLAATLQPQAQVSFGELLQKIGNELYTVQQQAQQASLDFSEGKQVELHETMLKQETAAISLRFLMTMRSRMLEAYKEIMHLGNP